MAIFFVLLIALQLGCGSPPPSEPAAEPGRPSTERRDSRNEPPPAAEDPRPLIVAFGDSLTSGHGLRAGQSYPDFLQQELDRKGYAYQVRNEGISGDTTSAGLLRAGIVAASNAEFVIVAFGGNDGLRGLSPDSMKNNLREIVTTLNKDGTTVVLAGMKLPPNYGREYTESFEAVFHELAEEMGTPLIPFLLEGVGGYPEFMQEDGVHPNADGAHKVATHVMKFLEPLLVQAPPYD